MKHKTSFRNIFSIGWSVEIHQLLRNRTKLFNLWKVKVSDESNTIKFKCDFTGAKPICRAFAAELFDVYKSSLENMQVFPDNEVEAAAITETVEVAAEFARQFAEELRKGLPKEVLDNTFFD